MRFLFNQILIIHDMNYFLLIEDEGLILPFLIYSKSITLFAIFEFLLQ